MAISKRDIFYTKLNSIKSTIEKSSDSQKKVHIAKYMGDTFNTLLSEIETEYPELNSSLPPKIRSTGVYSRAQMCDITYLDLEILTETTLSLLKLIEK